MRYVSTRGGPAVGIEKAIMGGTADDGGLYVPEALPVIQAEDFVRYHRVSRHSGPVSRALLRRIIPRRPLVADLPRGT